MAPLPGNIGWVGAFVWALWRPAPTIYTRGHERLPRREPSLL
jgi:hypothetical protein